MTLPVGTERVLLSYVAGKGRWLGLHDGDPLQGGSEPRDAAYARQQVRFSHFDDEIRNTEDVVFPEARENWGLLTHWSLMSDANGTAETVAVGRLAVPTDVRIRDEMVIYAGRLSVAFEAE